MKLSHEEVDRELQALPGWSRRGNAIEKTFERSNFDGSIAFVNAVARAANEQNHHPDIAITWDRVTLTLSSHDEGGITERDVALAKAIETIAATKPT